MLGVMVRCQRFEVDAGDDDEWNKFKFVLEYARGVNWKRYTENVDVSVRHIHVTVRN